MVKPRKRSPHSSSAELAHWKATYESTPYADLPWFSPDPSPQVIEAVKERFFRRGGSVVDVGCGAGTNVIYLASQGFDAHGIDLSPGAIQAAQDRARKAKRTVDVRVGDGLALPFSGGTLDGVVDNGCFHTLRFGLRKAYAKELARVLKPGASFVLSWIGRETTTEHGPPHRPSLAEVAAIFEPGFLFVRTGIRHEPSFAEFTFYFAWLTRRVSPQPPRR